MASHVNNQLGTAYGLTLTYVPAVKMFWVTAPGYEYIWEAW